jgi:integrase
MLADGYAAASVVHVHSTARKALNDALRWGVVVRNVALFAKAPRIPRREMQTWSPDETRRFLDAARGDRLEGLYVLALTCGMRQGELLALRWEFVDLDARLVQVRGTLRRTKAGVQITEPKNGRYRQAALCETAIDALRRHRMNQELERARVGSAWRDEGFVFTNSIGGPLEAPNMLRSSFKPLIEASKVRRIRFHDLRHTCASLLLAQNTHPKLVAELLGHSSVSVTLSVYAHVTPVMHAEAAATFDKLLAPTIDATKRPLEEVGDNSRP